MTTGTTKERIAYKRKILSDKRKIKVYDTVAMYLKVLGRVCGCVPAVWVWGWQSMKHLEFQKLERRYYKRKVITLWTAFCIGFAIGAGIATAIINSLPRG